MLTKLLAITYTNGEEVLKQWILENDWKMQDKIYEWRKKNYPKKRV